MLYFALRIYFKLPALSRATCSDHFVQCLAVRICVCLSCSHTLIVVTLNHQSYAGNIPVFMNSLVFICLTLGRFICSICNIMDSHDLLRILLVK